MSNGNFIVQNGLQVGPLTIDAATGSISTSGNVSITGNLGVSQISKNDSSIAINDTGASSTVTITIDGTTETTIDASGIKLPSGNGLYVNGASVLNATTLGSGVVNSSLTSVGTLTNLTVTNTITGSVSGNAGTATKLATARTIALTGDVTGSATFDGSGNISIATTSAADSIVLGTDTTGNYVATVAGTANQVTVSGSGTETAAVTLSLPQDIHTGASPTFAGATLTGALSGTSISAATIGNTGATLTGTLQTASQTNITGLGTVTTGTWNATTIATSKGGTGLTTFTSGGALYATSTSALTTGTLPVASGGTGTTTSTGSGSVVLSTSPSLTTPVIGAASGTSLSLSGALNATGAATLNSLGVNVDVVIGGNLTVNGTTTTMNTDTVTVEDKNITLANVATPTDVTADGGGITVLGSTNKTFNWVSANSAWTSSEDINVVTGKGYEINGASVLNATTLGSGVVNSSLTSVGTLTNLTVTNTITGSVSGNAGTATKLATARTISLTGDVTGSVSFDGSGNAAIAATIAADSVILGTDTTGNYVASLVAGTGISVGAAGESATPTITNTGVTSIAGTANQVTASASTGGVTLSLPQNIHTSATPTFAGITVPSITKGGTSGTGDIGASGATFGTVWAKATSAQYADLAEYYAADCEYEPGTVVCFGGDAEVTQCTTDHCRKVAGVVSTNPAYIMNSELQGTRAAVALQGRVPCKVVGPVRKGDMMVAAGNGRARAESEPKTGAVIGKALENFDGVEGVIEVVIGRV